MKFPSLENSFISYILHIAKSKLHYTQPKIFNICDYVGISCANLSVICNTFKQKLALRNGDKW